MQEFSAKPALVSRRGNRNSLQQVFRKDYLERWGGIFYPPPPFFQIGNKCFWMAKATSSQTVGCSTETLLLFLSDGAITSWREWFLIPSFQFPFSRNVMSQLNREAVT